MPIAITPERMREIEQAEYGLNGDIGGLFKQTYYTPDGRTIQAVPAIRHFVKRDKAGKTIGSGQRDANLDKGWLLSPPLKLRLFCPTCDRWHDTRAEVSACKEAQTKFIQDMTVKAKREIKREEASEASALKKEVAELKALVNKLMEGQKRTGGMKHRKVLQPKTNASTSTSRQQRPRKAKKGIQ